MTGNPLDAFSQGLANVQVTTHPTPQAVEAARRAKYKDLFAAIEAMNDKSQAKSPDLQVKIEDVGTNVEKGIFFFSVKAVVKNVHGAAIEVFLYENDVMARLKSTTAPFGSGEGRFPLAQLNEFISKLGEYLARSMQHLSN